MPTANIYLTPDEYTSLYSQAKEKKQKISEHLKTLLFKPPEVKEVLKEAPTKYYYWEKPELKGNHKERWVEYTADKEGKLKKV